MLPGDRGDTRGPQVEVRPLRISRDWQPLLRPTRFREGFFFNPDAVRPCTHGHCLTRFNLIPRKSFSMLTELKVYCVGQTCRWLSGH